MVELARQYVETHDPDLSLVKNRKPSKAALDLTDIEFAAAVLDSYDRVDFDYMRYTGSRMDEAN